jgi:hypothetical protein
MGSLDREQTPTNSVAESKHNNPLPVYFGPQLRILQGFKSYEVNRSTWHEAFDLHIIFK